MRFLLFFILILPFALAQTVVEDKNSHLSDEEYAKKKEAWFKKHHIAVPSPTPKPIGEEVDELLDQGKEGMEELYEKLSAMIKEMGVDEKELKKMQGKSLPEMMEMVQKGEFKAGENIKSEDMQKILKTLAPMLSRMDSKKLEQSILEGTKHTPFGGLFARFPKLATYYAKVMTDEKALEGLLSIAGQKTKLIIFLLCNILTIFLGIVIKNRQKQNEPIFMAKVFNFFKRIFILYSVRLGLIYLFFGKELGPAWRIVVDTWKS